MVIHFGYLAKIVDVDMASLYRNLEEEIYLECSQGMSDTKKVTASFEQVHLWPCSSCMTVVKESCQDPEEIGNQGRQCRSMPLLKEK